MFSSFPRQLKLARLQHGWSQARLASLLATDSKTVSRWELGQTVPTAALRERLVEVFESDLYQLGLLEEEEGALKTPAPIFDPTVPLAPGIKLVGREKEFKSIRARLRSGGNVALSALNGIPGVGKTALAVALAHDSEIRTHFKDGILWAGLGPEPNVQGHLSRWGTLLGMSSSEMSTLTGIDDWVLALHRVIGLQKILLVIDDVWSPEGASHFKIGGPNCAHLLTTRFPSIATMTAVGGAHEVAELDAEDGLQLLHILAPQAVEQEPQLARELVMAVGGLPLALNLMGNYLRVALSGPRRRLLSALQSLKDASTRLELSEVRSPVERHSSQPEDGRISLRTIIEVSDSQLSDIARDAFYALSIFPPKPNNFSEDAALTVTSCPAAILDSLLDMGLIQYVGSDRYCLHQTIADYARSTATDVTDVHERFITYMVSFIEAHSQDFEMLEIESNNVLAALDTAYEQKRLSELTRIVCAFAPFLITRGLFQLAERYLQRVYLALQSLSDHGNLASVLLYLGEIARKQSRYEQAEKYFREGLEHAREGANMPVICSILAKWGSLTWRRGDYSQAEKYLQEGLTLAQNSGLRRETVLLLDILGSVTQRQANYTQSEIYLQEALELARQIGEQELLCGILVNLGVTAGEHGNDLQSEILFKEGLELARRLKDREKINFFLNNLGDLATRYEDYESAEQYFLQALEFAKGVAHSEGVSIVLTNLGLVKRKQGDYDAALLYLQDGLALARQIGIPSLLCLVLYEWGCLCLDQHQLEEASSTFQEILALLPNGSQALTALAHYGLARTAHMNGSFQEARRLGEMSVAILEKVGHYNTSEVKEWFLSIFGE